MGDFKPVSQDPYYKSAFRYVGRGVRVDVDKLHELERQRATLKPGPQERAPDTSEDGIMIGQTGKSVEDTW